MPFCHKEIKLTFIKMTSPAAMECNQTTRDVEKREAIMSLSLGSTSPPLIECQQVT